MDPDDLLALAVQLVDQSEERGAVLRILGSLAVIHHTQESGNLLKLLDRVPTHDIDFMGYSAHMTQIDHLFRDLGYEPDRSVAFSLEYGVQRMIYHHREDQIMAEIFLDELRMAHTLDFRGRLELDKPTIPLVDLLLSKLQIQQITEKDIKDVIALLAGHDFGQEDRERIDISQLLALTRHDWGLYYTSKKNLEVIRQRLQGYDQLDASVREGVDTKLRHLLARMEAEPKTLRWKLRAAIGTRVRWYDEVGDVHDVYA